MDSELQERFLEARAYKDRWLALYKELYFYVIPNRDAFNIKFNYTDTGKPVTQQVWDDTAVLAAYQRANDLHGLLLPKDRVWGKLVLDPHLYPKQLIKQAQGVMDEINSRIFFYLNESNLSRVVSSSNLDLVGGTGAIWVESISDEVPLYFRSIPAVALYIEYSTDDVINTCWYGCKKTGRSVLKDFPDYSGKQLKGLQENPNDSYIVNYGQIRYSDDHYYIYAFLDDDPLYPLWERDSTYPQIIVYRDRVRPGEAEGRGVGMDLLPTIKDLNRITEYSRKNMAFKANPPIFYDAGSYFNPFSVRQWAGAMIARNPQGRNPLEAMNMPEHPDVLQHIIRLQETILKGFQVDPLGEINTPVRSATEVSIRENRAQRTSATDISRLINEQPKQIFDVSARILNERGLLQKPNKTIPGFSTKKLKFDYVSPLYDLQNQEDLNHFQMNLQIKQQYFGEGAALATVNIFEANEFLTEKLNLPRKLFASDDEIRKFLQGLAQKQEEAAIPSPATTAAPAKLPEAPGVVV
ncbi:head-tail connector protein [Candidatus Parcubacteria bacterium]|nr:head-tail connector protein [Candidatus Parcubacteria bacterium]